MCRVYTVQGPKQNLGGERASDTCRQVPLLVNFWEKPTFRVWCLYRYLVHGGGGGQGSGRTALLIRKVCRHVLGMGGTRQKRKSRMVGLNYCMRVDVFCSSGNNSYRQTNVFTVSNTIKYCILYLKNKVNYSNFVIEIVHSLFYTVPSLLHIRRTIPTSTPFHL